MTITPEHKREYRESRHAVIDAIARLNAVLVETARSYRAEFRMVNIAPSDDDEDDEGDKEEQQSNIGREGAEREDEGIDL
jgi:hypothetical protein